METTGISGLLTLNEDETEAVTAQLLRDSRSHVEALCNATKIFDLKLPSEF